MSLKMGFFPDFKGRDTVLLAGTSTDIGELRLRIELFNRSTADVLDLGTIASNSSRHPAKLSLAKSEDAAHLAGGFVLICSKDSCEVILEMLEPLARIVEGHQYFDLSGNSARLMVSVGEYSQQWWRDNA